MDAALQNALAKRDERLAGINAGMAEIEKLQERIRELQEAIVADAQAAQEINSFIAKWYEMAGIKPPEPTAAPTVTHIAPNPIQRDLDLPTLVLASPNAEKPKNPDRKHVAQVAAEIVLEAGRPLSRAQLMDGLQKRGIVLQGKDPAMVLSTMLWRTPETITRLEGHGYWPTWEPYPPANYVGQ